MDFYISWSHSDPIYQLYDRQCSMLISPTSITSVWQITRFPKMPYQLMIDSGGYSYVANQQPPPTPRQVFQRQIEILAKCDLPTTICTLDVPILGRTTTIIERSKAIDKTIANAWELKLLMAEYSKKKELGKQKIYSIKPMAIVQGYDIISLKYCARRLKELGYTHFGIGSLAHLYVPNEIRKRVEAVQSIVGSHVHIFGVSGIETMKLLSEVGVTSVDSTRPIKAAIYNEILYSEPYQRFGIAGSKFSQASSKFSQAKMVKELTIACPCPVCEGKVNNDLLKLGTRKHLLLRAIHNYYHLKKMISLWVE